MSLVQLERARAFQREFELEFPLIEANAEAVPLPSASFDLAISEYCLPGLLSGFLESVA